MRGPTEVRLVGPAPRRLGRIIGCLAILLSVSAASSDQEEKASLVVVTPGIRDGASDAWMGVAAQFSSAADRWVIRQEGVGSHSSLIEPDNSALNSVPANHVITLRRDVTSEEVRRTVHAIAAAQHAQVIVDMDLSSAGIGWEQQTHWAANVVQGLAEEHRQEHALTTMTWVGHSAGTEPMHMVSAHAEAGGNLFDNIYALSPRSPLAHGWPDQALMVIRNNDWMSTPDGYIPDSTVLNPGGDAYVRYIASTGRRVLQETDNGSGSSLASTLIAQVYPMLESHTAVHNVAVADQQMLYWQPFAREPATLGQANLVQAVRTVRQIDDSHAESPAEIKNIITETAPTPGLGGISLSPSFLAPLAPERIRAAICCRAGGGIVLLFKSGRQVAVPGLPVDVLKTAYDLAYVRGEKAELSIGGAHEESPTGKVVTNLNTPGKSAVYYFGHTRDTLLGLAMYQADDRLGELSFAAGPLVQSLKRSVPAYRALPELYPEKYADNPAQERFLGSSQRIFLDAQVVPTHLSNDHNALILERPIFSIRFGQSGPAELAYADLFQARFDDIAAAPEGRPFAVLEGYVQAIGLFRWLKANHIPVVAGGLASYPVARIFTPTEVPETPPTRLADVRLVGPSVMFGPFGPVRVAGRTGDVKFEYRQGRLASVHRPDGRQLEVMRDAIGQPLAVTDGRKVDAIYLDRRAGLIFATSVEMHSSPRAPEVRFTNSSSYAPISNAENLVGALAARFAREGVLP